MHGKAYSIASLSMMINAVNKYTDEATGIRDQLIAKCHQEIGLIVIDAPVSQREGITLTEQEERALRDAVLRLRRASKKGKKVRS